MATAIDPSVFTPVKVKWGKVSQTSFGRPLEAFELTIPVTVSGRLDVYSVPKCDAYPEGYFFNLCTGAYYDNVEPGCQAWEKHLLLQLRLVAAPTTTDAEQTMTTNAVEYQHPDIALDTASLNPNDYAAYIKELKDVEAAEEGK